MANTSEELIQSVLISSSQWNVYLCIEEKAIGIHFCYFIMALCFLIGTAANSWCLWFYLFADLKNRQPQVFLLNYIIMELILCIECGLEILTVFIIKNNTLLLLTYFMFGLSWTGRPLMQACICIEQYIAVIHPVKFLRYKGIKYRTAVAATAWLMAFGCGIYYTYSFIYNFYYCSVSVFFMAVSVIFFCCVPVLCALKYPRPGDITKQTGRDVGNQQKRNAFNIILSALLIILLTYLPQVLSFISTVIKKDYMLFDCNIAPFVFSINIFSVIITPFMNMYKEGQLKCVKCPKKIKETS